MEPALIVGLAFFPLDEELGLLGGGLTPRGEETLVRLSTWMPYESARELLEELLGVQVSRATARRVTLHTGEAALAVCEAEVERAQAGNTPGVCGSGQASDEWRRGLCAPGRRRVGGSQDTGDRRGHAQSARRGLHAAPLVLLAAQ